jgi:uncharacterized protein
MSDRSIQPDASGHDPGGAPIAPTVNDLNRPFWDGCAVGELRLQACTPCGHVRYPISEICPRCLSPEFRWHVMSGHGEIVSWVMFQHAYNPAWATLVPYNVVLVQLPEGPRLFGNVEPLASADLNVGAQVRVAFAVAPDGAAVPRWRITEPS